MSLRTFVKLVTKAFKFTVSRPIQRFNIYNRSKRYLGPDADRFTPAPRAIGPLSQISPSQYPHLESGSGYRSTRQRRLDALAKNSGATQDPLLADTQSTTLKLPKSFSETASDDNFIRQLSSKLEVTKSVTNLGVPQRNHGMLPLPSSSQITDGNEADPSSDVSGPSSRPLPKCTNLDLSDPASIWIMDKVPKGRLNLNMLQEIMVNKLADDKHWTTKVVAEKYDVKEEYVESLLKYLKQIQIIVSPQMAKMLDYAGRNDPVYQATKHIVYHVDKRLRSDVDKKYDKMFLPSEQLDDEVRSLLDEPGALQVERANRRLSVQAKPEPLRLAPINRETNQESSQRLLVSDKQKTTSQEPKET